MIITLIAIPWSPESCKRPHHRKHFPRCTITFAEKIRIKILVLVGYDQLLKPSTKQEIALVISCQ